MRGVLIRWFLLGLLLLPLNISQALANTFVAIETIKGVITLELYDDKAPVTVGNFLKYVDGGFYSREGMFYRVVRKDNDHGTPVIEVIQGGISVEDVPLPFPNIVHEDTEKTGIKHLDGVISMARGSVGSAGDAFFIVIGAQPSLDKGGMRNPDGAGFAAFGRVVAGMDVVKYIHNIRDADNTGDAYVAGQMLRQPVKITLASRVSDPTLNKSDK